MIFLFFLSCAAWVELDGLEACNEVQTAVAARTLACTGKQDLSSANAEALEGATTCRWEGTSLNSTNANVSSDDMVACTTAIGEATCEDVAALGDQPGWWLGLSDRCEWLFDFTGPAVVSDADTCEPGGSDASFVGSCSFPLAIVIPNTAGWQGSYTLRGEDETCLASACSDQSTGFDYVIELVAPGPGTVDLSVPRDSPLSLGIWSSPDGCGTGTLSTCEDASTTLSFDAAGSKWVVFQGPDAGSWSLQMVWSP